MHYGLTISEEYLGEASPVLIQGGLEKAMKTAHDWGFDAVEMHIRDPKSIDITAVEKQALRYDIRIAAIGTGLEYAKNGLCFTHEDPSIRSRTCERFKEHLDFGKNFDAPVFLGMLRGSAPSYASIESYLDRLYETMMDVVEYADKINVTIAFEPIVFYLTNLLNTVQQTLDFLCRPGLETVKILADTHHMFIEDPDLFEAFLTMHGRIVHVHLSDSNRRAPGFGKIDYANVLRALAHIGYDKTVSLEVLPWPNAKCAAQSGLLHMKRCINDARNER